MILSEIGTLRQPALLNCEARADSEVQMIIPLVGCLLACTIFGCIGAALLALIPHLRPTLVNIALFVIGAVPSCGAAAIAYGRVFGDATGELRLPAVVGLFAVLLVAGVCGGLLAVVAYRWLTRTIHLQRDSDTRSNDS